MFQLLYLQTLQNFCIVFLQLIHFLGNELVVKKQYKSFEESVSIGVETLKRRLKKSKEKLRDSIPL